MLSGRLVPSNHWRALEVVKAAEADCLPETADLREAYEVMRPGVYVPLDTSKRRTPSSAQGGRAQHQTAG